MYTDNEQNDIYYFRIAHVNDHYEM